MLNGFLLLFFRNFIILTIILNYFINYLNISVMVLLFIFDEVIVWLVRILSVFLILFFAHLVWAFVYYRSPSQIEPQNGKSFREEVNKGKRVFYILLQENSTVSFVNGEGKDTSAFFLNSEFECQIAFLSADSMIPSKGYRVDIAMTKLRFVDKGKKVISVFFMPMNNSISIWTVSKIEIATICIEHPIMGTLILPTPLRQNYTLGQQVKLISKVSKDGNTYRLTYDFLD